MPTIDLHIALQPDLQSYATLARDEAARTRVLLETFASLGPAKPHREGLAIPARALNVLDPVAKETAIREFLNDFGAAHFDPPAGTLDIDTADPVFSYYYDDDEEHWKREGYFITRDGAPWAETVTVPREDGTNVSLQCRFLLTVRMTLELGGN